MKNTKTILRALLIFIGMLSMNAQAGVEITYMHNDALGSAVVGTDAQGSVKWRSRYQPYGTEILGQRSSSGTRAGFTGHRDDPESGLTYMGARYYSPSIGRFMGLDPAGVSESNLHSFNRFAYANNNPYKFVDPDGEVPVPLIIWGISAYLFVDSVTSNAPVPGHEQDGISSVITLPGPVGLGGKAAISATMGGAGDLVDAAGGVAKNAKKGDIRAPGGRDRAKELFREFDAKGVGGRTKVRERDGSRAVVGELGDGTPLRIRFKKNGTTRIQAGKQKIQFND